jgi:hypothetical protein
MNRRLCHYSNNTKCCAIAPEVSSRLPSAADRVRAHVTSCGICGGQNGTEAGFHLVLRVPMPIVPQTAPHSSLSILRDWYNRPNSGRNIVLGGLSLTPKQNKTIPVT